MSGIMIVLFIAADMFVLLVEIVMSIRLRSDFGETFLLHISGDGEFGVVFLGVLWQFNSQSYWIE